jgi:hypothetical protein
MKKTIVAVLIFAMLLPSVTLLSGCGGGGGSSNFTPGTPTSYITLNINPAVEIIADENDKVTAVNAINDDGTLLVYGKNYFGYDVDIAISEMVKVAAGLGYIPAYSEDAAQAVYVSVFGTNSEVEGRVYSKIKASTDNFFENNGLFAVVAQTVMDNKILTEASKSNMTSDQILRFRLMLKAMEYDADIEFTEAKDYTRPELIEKVYDEMQIMAQIASKAQKDAYLDNRISLKQDFEDSLVTLFNQATYTQLYNEIKALKEEYRTADLEDTADIVAQIEAKEEEIAPIENTLRNQYSSQIVSLEVDYAQTINNSLSTFIQASISDKPDFDAITTNKIVDYMWRLEERQQYAQYSENNFSNEYGVWKPLAGTNLTEFIQALDSYTQAKTATKNEVGRALNRLNPYTRSFGFGDSSGATWTFP